MAPKTDNPLERAVVVLSLDTEQIWGYLDVFDEARFSAHYPGAATAGDRMLDMLCEAGISATWALVGGLTLEGSAGLADPRLAGLPARWAARVRAGTEATAPLWYRRSFALRLLASQPAQELGLHGGLTHLIWTDGASTLEVIRRELDAGLAALRELNVRPGSFVFPRNQTAHPELLRERAFHCYRGHSACRSARFGRTLAGAVARAVEELGCLTPWPIWPEETLPGLWEIPASLCLYPMSPRRALFVGLRTRLARVRRGLAAAIRCRGIFHLSLHPENLAESPRGFEIFEDMVELIARARDAGEVEILTMAEVAARMEELRAPPVLETPESVKARAASWMQRSGVRP